MAIDIYDVLYGKRTGLNTAKILDADEIKVVYRHRKQPSDLSSFGQLFTGTRASHFALIGESGLNRLGCAQTFRKPSRFKIGLPVQSPSYP